MPYVLEHDLASGWRALWELSETEDYFLDLNVWSKDDLHRLTQMENPARRIQWLATRFILKDKLGATTPLHKNKQGKPQLDQGFISLSHSKECAAVVFDQNHEVGVDVEEIGEKVKRVAKKFLTDEEFIILEGYGGDESLQLTKAWTAKEVVFKWFGHGELPFREAIQIQNITEDTMDVVLSADGHVKLHRIHHLQWKNTIMAYL